MNSFDVIKTVRLTEKGTRQGEKFNQYTVVADRRATKPQIRQAVQDLFKVKVTKVNTLNVRGKLRRQRTAQEGVTNTWKKAIVTLKEGVHESEELKKELVAHVRKEIGPIAAPDKLQFAPGLPKTRSGKIMRRILRKIAENQTDQIGDVTTLADPGVVTALVQGKQ